MNMKLLTEHHLEFLSLKGGCTCSSESTHVKMPHCWKSHDAAHFVFKTYHIQENCNSENSFLFVLIGETTDYFKHPFLVSKSFF